MTGDDHISAAIVGACHDGLMKHDRDDHVSDYLSSDNRLAYQ
jgi:hypothetical protein